MFKFEMGGGCPLGSTAWVVLIAIVLFLYVLWDVNYFIRIFVTIGWARLFGPKHKVGDKTKIFGKFFCLFIYVAPYIFIKQTVVLPSIVPNDKYYLTDK